MKRLFSIFAAGLMAAAVIVSCNKDPQERGGEGDEKAPVLKAIDGAVLDAKGAPITTTFEAADFGVSTSIGYELAVAKAGTDMKDEAVVNADIAAGNISMKQGNLSLAIQKLGFAVGDEAEVEFALYAYIGSSRGKNSLRSNLVKATFTVCAAKQDDSALDKIVEAFNKWLTETEQRRCRQSRCLHLQVWRGQCLQRSRLLQCQGCQWLETPYPYGRRQLG